VLVNEHSGQSSVRASSQPHRASSAGVLHDPKRIGKDAALSVKLLTSGGRFPPSNEDESFAMTRTLPRAEE
jgi:hypothetical protein